ncbi:zf-HC2 domain-containing protein [Lachnospiraceae bacterium 46-61]
MKCDIKQEYREEKISLYIDRQLDWKEEKEFLKHIRQCEECNKALQEAKYIREMLLTLPDECVPKELHSDIMKALQKEMTTKVSPAKNKKSIPFTKYGALAASFLILVTTGAYFYNQNLKNTSNTEDMPELAYMYDEGMMQQTENNEILPQITQTKSGNITETSRAFPATPALGSEQNEQQKLAESGESPEATEVLQNDTNGEQTTEQQDAQIAALSAQQEDVLTQPIPVDEMLYNDEKQQNDDVSLQSAEEQQQDTNVSIKRSMPSNMKSKSMEIHLNIKNADKFAKEIEKRTKSLKGEIVSEYTGGNMTIKVPLLEYNNMLNWLGEQCKILDKNEFVEDLAQQYKEIQKQAESAASKQKQSEQKGQTRKAQDAKKVQQDCQTALEELEKTAEFATISITLSE